MSPFVPPQVEQPRTDRTEPWLEEAARAVELRVHTGLKDHSCNEQKTVCIAVCFSSLHGVC